MPDARIQLFSFRLLSFVIIAYQSGEFPLNIQAKEKEKKWCWNEHEMFAMFGCLRPANRWLVAWWKSKFIISGKLLSFLNSKYSRDDVRFSLEKFSDMLWAYRVCHLNVNFCIYLALGWVQAWDCGCCWYLQSFTSITAILAVMSISLFCFIKSLYNPFFSCDVLFCAHC